MAWMGGNRMHLLHRVLALLMAVIPLSCGDKIEPGQKADPPVTVTGVSIMTVGETERPLLYEAVGTVVAGIKTQIGGKLMGTVEEIRVREGDRVKEGDVLVVLDARQVKAELGRAEAGMTEAQKGLAAALSAREAAAASERLALTTHERYVNLKREQSVSKQEFDEVEARYRQSVAALREANARVEAAMARVSQADAGVKTARVGSEDALIRAPHPGVISGKFVAKGDLARPGVQLLTLETTRGFCVDAIVPETYLRFLDPGRKVRVRVPALGDGPQEGTICTLVPGADPSSRSFVLKVNLLSGDPVTSGLFARVEIPIGVTRQILVPATAVIRNGQLTGLYVVDEKRLVHLRLVRLGKRYGENFEVLSGLRAGEKVVREATPGLKDGVRAEAAS